MEPGASSTPKTSIEAAVAALERGYQAIPIRDGEKRPSGFAWTHTRWNSREEVALAFARHAEDGAHGVGLLLGSASNGLVDVDLDHPLALRLRDHLLPPSPMETGRAGRPRSHRWYRVTDNLPTTRQCRMPGGGMIVELRSTDAQTIIPPTVHVTGEVYHWEGEPWGGSAGPTLIEGNELARQVLLLAMGATLMENWPEKGGRHEAYLALAGGLLRGEGGVHPYWAKNLPVLIEALADATHDRDGASARKAEVMNTTLTRLREGGKASGFPRLAEMIGSDLAEQTRRWSRDLTALAGYTGTPIRRVEVGSRLSVDLEPVEDMLPGLTLPPAIRNPMEERASSWAAVDLGPYLSGEVTMPQPSILVRSDGKGLMYPGRVNSLFGLSESAKSWIALWACMQEMDKGGRAVYIDLEDMPEGTIARAQALGTGAEDLTSQFKYVHPEGPLADMQRYRFGSQPNEEGRASAAAFKALLDVFDPTIIVADGMTALYGLHGHDTNEATATEVITGWLKSLCRNGQSTVIVIDHTGKTSGAGSSPIGAHHKVAMVQGTALRVDVLVRPMPCARGEMNLVVFKDRPGAVRKISSNAKEQVAGLVIIDSTDSSDGKDVTHMRIEPPDPNDVVVANSDRMDASLALRASILELYGGDVDMVLTTKVVVDRLGCTDEEARAAWKLLVASDDVSKDGENRWSQYKLKV